MKNALSAAALAVLLACSGGGSSDQPPANVAGVWSGSVARAVVVGGTEVTSTVTAWFDLAQNGASVTGRYMTTGGSTIGTSGVSGTVTGTVTGDVLNFTVAVTAPGCDGGSSFSGSATIRGDVLDVDYSRNSICGSEQASGVLVRTP